MSTKKKINKSKIFPTTKKVTLPHLSKQNTSSGIGNNKASSKIVKTTVFRKKLALILALSGLVIIALIVFGVVLFLQRESAQTTSVNIANQNASSVQTPGSSLKIEIRDVTVTDITEKSMTIQWKTNLPATSEVSASEQNSTNSLGGWPDNKLVLEHKVTLEKLTPSSSYILKIKSKDASGNEALFESNNVYQTQPSRTNTDIVVGQKAPDFTLQTLTGENISLSAQRDKKTMLVFWLMSCSSCRDELPFLQDFWGNTKPDDLSLFAINIGENENLIKNYVISQKLTFPILLDQDSVVSKKYTVVHYPTIFLLAPDKTVTNIKEEPFRNTTEIKEFIQPTNQPK